MQVGGTKSVQSDINVTPLIDVVLVLLIIFMVITPIVLQETLLHMPKMEVVDEELDPSLPGALVVKLNADNTIAFRVGEAEEQVTQELLVEKLKSQLSNRRDKSVFVDASTLVAYGQAVAVFDLCKGVGSTLAVVETDDEEDLLDTSGAPAMPGAAPPPSP